MRRTRATAHEQITYTATYRLRPSPEFPFPYHLLDARASHFFAPLPTSSSKFATAAPQTPPPTSPASISSNTSPALAETPAPPSAPSLPSAQVAADVAPAESVPIGTPWTGWCRANRLGGGGRGDRRRHRRGGGSQAPPRGGAAAQGSSPLSRPQESARHATVPARTAATLRALRADRAGELEYSVLIICGLGSFVPTFSQKYLVCWLILPRYALFLPRSLICCRNVLRSAVFPSCELHE